LLTVNVVKLDPDHLVLILRSAATVWHDTLKHGDHIAKHGLGPESRQEGKRTGERGRGLMGGIVTTHKGRKEQA
jgi:hypothetical protein